MKQNGHVVFVIGSVEARNIDQGIAQAISKVLRIQRRPPVIGQVYELPIVVGVLYILRVRSAAGVDVR